MTLPVGWPGHRRMKLAVGLRKWPPSRVETSWDLDTNLGGALLDWIDTEDTSTLSLSGNLVNSIRAKRTGTVFSQTLTASKPVFSATGILGRPAIIGDGEDDFLEVTPTPAAWPTGSAPLEIWSLANPVSPNSDTTERWLVSYGGGANTTRRHGRGSAVGQIQARTRAGTGSSTQAAGSSNPPYIGPHIVRSIYAADGTLTVEIDGAGPVSVASTIATTTGRARLFANDANTPGNFWQGGLNSVYFINPLHPNWTEANRAALYDFLNARRVPAMPAAALYDPLYSEYVTDSLFLNAYVEDLS